MRVTRMETLLCIKHVQKEFNLGEDLVGGDPLVYAFPVPLETIKSMFRESLKTENIVKELKKHINDKGGDSNPYISLLGKFETKHP